MDSLQDGDIVAERQADGRYSIRRWRATDHTWVPIHDHQDHYDLADTLVRLKWLGSTGNMGDTYLSDEPGVLRLVQP